MKTPAYPLTTFFSDVQEKLNLIEVLKYISFIQKDISTPQPVTAGSIPYKKSDHVKVKKGKIETRTKPL